MILQVVAPPFAVYDEASTQESSPVTIAVLENDIIDPASPVTIDVYTQPANGTVTLIGDSFVYTPETGFSGTDTFTYTICDQNAACSTATVTIVVSAQADTRPVPVLPPLGLLALVAMMVGLVSAGWSGRGVSRRP